MIVYDNIYHLNIRIIMIVYDNIYHLYIRIIMIVGIIYISPVHTHNYDSRDIIYITCTYA